MDLSETAAVGPPAVSWVRRPSSQVLVFIALATAAKVILALVQEPDVIEAYHWLYGRHPAAGYTDHPGMIGWLVWASTTVFGHSLLAVRLPTIVGSGLAVWLLFLTGRLMYGDKAGRLAAFLMGLVPLTARFAMEATPDAPLLLFWTAAIWAIAHALKIESEIASPRPAVRNPAAKTSTGWWMTAGLFIGAALDSKYPAILLPGGLVLFLLVSPEYRKRISRMGSWLAALIALTVFWPTVIWNAQHEWQSFAYQGVERMRDHQEIDLSGLAVFVRRQAALITPFVLMWIGGAAFKTVAKWRDAPWTDRLNVCLGVPVVFLFLAVACVRTVRAHWPVAGYVNLFLLSAAAVVQGGTWGKRLHGATLVILAAAGLAWPVYIITRPAEQVRPWERVADDVRRLHPDFVIASDYHHAALLAWRLRPVTAWDMTPVGREGKSFQHWWRPDPFVGKDAVVVTSKPPDPAEMASLGVCFEHIEGGREVTVSPLTGRPKTLLLWTARSYRPPPLVKLSHMNRPFLR